MPRTPRWRAAALDGVRFYQAVGWTPRRSLPARLSDGTPLLDRSHAGRGRVLVFASTSDNIANDLPLHAPFVPFVEQTARYLGAGRRPGGIHVDAHYELGEGLARRPRVLAGRNACSRSMKAARAAPCVTRAGFYDIKRPDGRRIWWR